LFPLNKLHAIALDETTMMIKFVGKIKEITTKLVQIGGHVLETRMV
jgi:hypothetical protein